MRHRTHIKFYLLPPVLCYMAWGIGNTWLRKALGLPFAFAWWLNVAINVILLGWLVVNCFRFARERRRIAAANYSMCERCGYPFDGEGRLRCSECGEEFDAGEVRKRWKIVLGPTGSK